MRDLYSDKRVVLTLDAGGTSFRFSAMRGGKLVVPTVTLPANGDNLDLCLANIVAGFEQVRAKCRASPVAISFAFPGPANYPAGIIGNLGNLPAFRGGVALGPMLAKIFDLPVFINNDGDLFTYGEAIAGFLPYVNGLLEKAGSPKRYKNLLGVTLGTGFGGGIMRDGELFVGDNSMAGEVWLLRNKLNPQTNAEEGVSIRAVRQGYLEEMGVALGEPTPDLAPDPKVIEQIALGTARGDQLSAREAYRQLGEVAGDAIAQALTLVDGLAVIGGGISGAWPLFLPALMNELNGHYVTPNGTRFRRLASAAFNLEAAGDLETFLQGDTRDLPVPGTTTKVSYDSLQRVGVGLSRLGTSEAVAIGAYGFALRKLDRQN